MIKQIKITNFYSFSQETIVLQPDVNILIGINGSGKSNFLKAVRFLYEGIAGRGLQAYIFENLGGFKNILFKGKQGGDENVIELAYTLDRNVLNSFSNEGIHFPEDIIYSVKIIRSHSSNNYFVEEHITTVKEGEYLHFKYGAGSATEMLTEDTFGFKISHTDFDSGELALREIGSNRRFPYLTVIRKSLRQMAIYEHFDTGQQSPIRSAVLATSGKRLNADAGNLAQILNTIKLNHKSAYHKIVAMLAEVNPNFSGIDFNVIGGSNIELMLEEKGLESSIHVSSISDGTLRYLCLLAILYNPERGKFICIDEPETGLHPDMIRGIAKAIKEAAQNSTIVVSTHSVNLLNYFSISDLRVFEKNDDNSTKVVTYTEEQFEGWYDVFLCGQMWVAGDFGGVRYGG